MTATQTTSPLKTSAVQLMQSVALSVQSKCHTSQSATCSSTSPTSVARTTSVALLATTTTQTKSLEQAQQSTTATMFTAKSSAQPTAVAQSPHHTSTLAVSWASFPVQPIPDLSTTAPTTTSLSQMQATGSSHTPTSTCRTLTLKTSSTLLTRQALGQSSSHTLTTSTTTILIIKLTMKATS